jgi:hypothetical protein
MAEDPEIDSAVPLFKGFLPRPRRDGGRINPGFLAPGSAPLAVVELTAGHERL